MALEQDVVELGFVEESQNPEDDFSSHNFPSKVGGKPVWLDPVALPAPDQLLCNECRKPCILLLQVYAPHTDDPATYHRSLYVFVCRDPACSKPGSDKSFRVLRCQLPKQNPYYTDDKDESSNNDSPRPSVSSVTPLQSLPRPQLCEVCGCSGPSKCGQCKAAHYCSQEHQLYHWKSGHKILCKALKSGEDVSSLPTTSTVGSFLLPEFEIITETEPTYRASSTKSEQEKLQDFEQYTSSESYITSCAKNIDLSAELSKLECDSKEDKLFKSFKKRIARAPEQVLRFQPGGEPLVISSHSGTLDSSIMPPCDNCGGKRQFELQVMPQLLHYLKAEHIAQQGHSIDWGTLLIYTCSGNCNPLPGYKEELLWKQDLL